MNRFLGNTSRRPDISFRADGRIDITSRITKALGINPGDVIDIAEIYPKEICLYIRHHADVCGRHEGRCYPVIRKNTRGAYRAWSKRLCDSVRSISNHTDSLLRLCCGEQIYTDNTIFIPIIYKLPL